MNINPIRAGNQNPDSSIGKTIDGKYRIASILGEGGMGTVHPATRLMIGDTVAVKILHSSQVSDPQAIERFRREAQAAARLKHQNAVTIYDFGVSNEGLVYLVMELAEGQSLRDIIKQQGPVTPSAAAEIMSPVCAALDEAHRQNIVHRDLKPDNIIVAMTNTGLRAKVLDFGIAKMRDLSASNLTQTGAVMGTPYYMSPEHCMGEELDHRSDIYKTFFREFSSAVRKRDRANLELMMSPAIKFPVEIASPSTAFDYLSYNNGEGWKQLRESVTRGTKPYKDSSPRPVARITNDKAVIFGRGAEGKWRWLRFGD